MDTNKAVDDLIERAKKVFASAPLLSPTETNVEFSADALRIDPAAIAGAIATKLQTQILKDLRRRGAVLGLSGGIDSSVVAALCVHAIGPDRVFGILMPEHDSDGDSLRLGQLLADTLGIRVVVEDIAPILAAAGCYRRRDDAIRQVFHEYDENYKSKIVMPDMLSNTGYAAPMLVIESPQGEQKRARLPLNVYLEIVAATSMKQRTRKQIEYYHADRLNYAVAGTPNRLEYDQGFFVKNGDGAADFKPIAHLYKTQVYRLADWFGVPKEICLRPPTTDTYSMAQTQEEFFFAIALEKFDLCLFAFNHHVPAKTTAATVGLSKDQVEQIYKHIVSRRRATRYQHEPPMLIEPVLDDWVAA